MRKIFLFLAVCCLFWSVPVSASENVKHTENTDVELFADEQHEIIARIQVKDGWHIYWQNPGEIGQATEISSNADFKVVNQSVPQVRRMYEMMNEYVYENEAFYHILVADFAHTTLNISFVECSDICKPETLSFDLSQISFASKKQWENIKKQAEQTFPEKIKVVSPTDRNSIEVRQDIDAATMQFIPAEREVIDQDSVQIYSQGQKTEIRWNNVGEQKLRQALLYTPNKVLLADIIYSNISDFSLWYVLILAFVGGILLNAMPCVFPILSLKIFALMKRKSYHHRVQHAVQYTLGVVSCFLVLAVFLIMVKHKGEAVGWGFQLQSPWFVGTMAVIFFVLFLFMMEWLKFPSLTNRFIYKTAGLNAYTTGFFAVLVASPCTGPFMGAAVGYAFMSTLHDTIAVFTALALGYALPYVLIEVFPQVIARIMPRPGKWMVRVKMILAIPLLLTAIWLTSILVTQLSDKESSSNEVLEWRVYDPQEVERLHQKKENILIDFTADWCLTCQVNEKILFRSDAFKKFVKEQGIHLFKADLTKDNPMFRDALNFYGREGIPLYVYYYGEKYEILPTFLRLSDLTKQ